jgi:hypothetical protein
MNISFRRLLHQETKKTLDNNTNSQKPFGNGSLPQVRQGDIQEEANAFCCRLIWLYIHRQAEPATQREKD